ncbi:Hypothetical predicted protein [Mytilus galloprovincialis]|uniref:G-protein coupled receptors family 1 profile domain-containing protein n=1 Tax=Mytilus galloprovincialis TaxID=29158 RepID=A0A8B6HID0_MYTGA|nr:Hypothetical predicted protein [Mytilus galloprovincialis]
MNETSVLEGFSVLESELEIWEDYCVACFLTLIGIIAVFLNGFVVYVFVRKMKKLASCDCYILNLAIIDIIMPLIGFPLPIYSSLHHELAIGEYLCATYGFTGFFCGVVSISTLAAISLARYVQVCRTDQGKFSHLESILINKIAED